MSESISIEDKIASVVRQLPDIKKAEVLDFAEWLSQKTKPEKESNLSSDDEEMKLLQQWLEQGLIRSIPDQVIDEQEFEPIIVEGKPASEAEGLITENPNNHP